MTHQDELQGDAADPRAALHAARAEATRQLETLTRDFDEIVDGSELVNTDDEHDPEGATIAFERAMVAALRDSAERRLAAIEVATSRLDDGSYGTCTGCGAPIAAERLEAVPDATACVTCTARGT